MKIINVCHLYVKLARKATPVLPIYRGTGGLVQGVDPRSNRSLFDAADDGT
jgi:hypothetical protein